MPPRSDWPRNKVRGTCILNGTILYMIDILPIRPWTRTWLYTTENLLVVIQHKRFDHAYPAHVKRSLKSNWPPFLYVAWWINQFPMIVTINLYRENSNTCMTTGKQFLRKVVIQWNPKGTQCTLMKSYISSSKTTILLSIRKSSLFSCTFYLLCTLNNKLLYLYVCVLLCITRQRLRTEGL